MVFLINNNTIKPRQKLKKPLDILLEFSVQVNMLFVHIFTKCRRHVIHECPGGFNTSMQINEFT